MVCYIVEKDTDLKGERVGETYGSVSTTGVASTSVSGESEPPDSRDVTGNQPSGMLVTADPSRLVNKHFELPNHFSAANMKAMKDDTLSQTANKYKVCEGVYGGHDPFFSAQRFGQENFAFDGSFCDPGYVSEKSDEEDPADECRRLSTSDDTQPQQTLAFPEPPDGGEPNMEYVMEMCPFVNEATVFEVTVMKNSRGLGMALTGGIECDTHWSGLIRIKTIYPQTPAYMCGQLEVNDLVLEANHNILTGLTSHEALEVLRTCGNEVHLVLCRTLVGVLEGQCETDQPSNSLAVPSNTSSFSQFLSPSPSFSNCGEFEIQLTKVNGSLGFTLRKRDNSILGHTVRTLVKEPALSHGTMRAGDKLLSVNGTDMCGLTHEEAVKFLRTCPDTVMIRLYRDAMQTPVSPGSPTETQFIPRPKQLRKEARDMLSNLAYRKQTSTHLSANGDSTRSTRLRRQQKTPSPEPKPVVHDRWESYIRNAGMFPNTPPDAQRDSNNSSFSSDGKPARPNFLDLRAHQSCSRKTNFTPPHEQCPSPNLHQGYGGEMTSLEPSSAHSDRNFSHSQPGYYSVNLRALHSSPQGLKNTSSDHDLKSHTLKSDPQNGLMKWKGIVFTPESEEPMSRDLQVASLEAKTVTIELTRGWNSRLGFSLQNQQDKTVISAIYADSVAAKDGRLKVGDQVLTVNGESVKDLSTDRTIDLLRKSTGKIVLQIRQKYF